MLHIQAKHQLRGDGEQDLVGTYGSNTFLALPRVAVARTLLDVSPTILEVAGVVAAHNVNAYL